MIHAACGRIDWSPIGCRCAAPPPDLRARIAAERARHLEQAAAGAPAAPEQLELLDLGPADAVREGIATVRAALRGQ